MNKKEKFKLDIIDRIDEDIIEKKTEERYALLSRMKKTFNRKTFIKITSAAASFFIIFGIVLTVILLMAKVPVYTGMTVSGEAPVVAQQATVAAPKIYPRIGITANAMKVTPFTMLNNTLDLSGDSEETTDIFEETTDVFEETTDIFEETTDTSKDSADTSAETTDVADAPKIAYYATVGQDIYITVHIDNPENFAILQFTLNGKVYNSYMFEEGSDMENLVLKYNVGDQMGYFEYTIDAIKYVDGTEIKDVRMKGDRTITVAVAPDQMPLARVTELPTQSEFDIKYKITVDDPSGVIELSNGEVYAVLKKHLGDGEYAEVERKKITVGERQDVIFEDLEPSSYYMLYVIATYNAFDGKDFTRQLAATRGIEIGSGIEFSAQPISEKGGQVSFELLQDIKSQATITKIELIEFGGDHQVIAELSPDSRLFENIPCGTYRVKVTFEDKGIVENIKSDPVCVDPYGIALQGSKTDCTIFNGSWTGNDKDNFAMLPDNAEGKIYSAMDGVVSAVSKNNSPLGDASVTISYSIGDKEYSIQYCGLKSVAEGIEEGTEISAGDVIGIADTQSSECSLESADHVHVFIYGWYTYDFATLVENGYFYFTEDSSES